MDKKLRAEHDKEYKLALDNIIKVIEYISTNYKFDYDWGVFGFHNLEIHSQNFEEDAFKKASLYFSIELWGDKEGKLIATTRVSIVPDPDVEDKSFGYSLEGKEIEAIYRQQKKALDFVNELMYNFDFIEN